MPSESTSRDTGQRTLNHRVAVYISGIYFAPMSVSVTAARNRHVQFQVEVPAIHEWDALQPRSHVVVFFADPVTNAWRLLCEGEYYSYTKSKTANGQHSRSLMCRGLHAYLDNLTISCVGSALNANDNNNGGTAEQNPSGSIQELALSGRLIGPSSSSLSLFSLNDIINRVSTSVSRVSSVVREVIRAATMQAPVEGFYFHYRKVLQKMFTLKDEELNLIMDTARWNELATQGANQRILNFSTTVSQLLFKYVSLALYQMSPVLAPAVALGTDAAEGIDSAGSRIIPEVLFTPHLYPAIPPACNVVFKDQVTLLSQSENFAAEPTRVISHLSMSVFSRLPRLYMANNPQTVTDYQILAQDQLDGQAGLMITHSLLSSDEMLRGVNVEHVQVGYEVLAKDEAPEQRGGGPGLEVYLAHATKHHYVVKRAEARTAQLQCVFLPFIVTGMPVLVEDKAGPFFAFVEAVSHSLPATGAPSTSLTLTHVRRVLLANGKAVERFPIPGWFNRLFRPSGIAGRTTRVDAAVASLGRNQSSGTSPGAGTWELLFGLNASDPPQSAMVPTADILDAIEAEEIGGRRNDATFVNSSVPFDAPEQVDIDVLAGKVVPVPQFDEGFNQFLGFTRGTIAEKLRGTDYRDPKDIPLALMRFNWRPGCRLSQYIAFHNLRGRTELRGLTASGLDTATSEAPVSSLHREGPDVSPAMFGSPYGMDFVGGDPVADGSYVNTAQGRFGPYRLVTGSQGGTIDPQRVQTARMIRRSLEGRKISQT